MGEMVLVGEQPVVLTWRAGPGAQEVVESRRHAAAWTEAVSVTTPSRSKITA